MRRLATAARIERLLQVLGRKAKGPGRIYLVGGATAALMGWRETTKDVDLKLEPEPPGIFEAIRDAKEELNINIELAAPDQFIPPVPGWQGRSLFITSVGEVSFCHYDLLSQALAKLERGHAQDLVDVRSMIERGLLTASALKDGLARIEDALIRYPAIEPAAFRDKLSRFLDALGDE